MEYVASVSFGKDSLAMLLKILELNLPLDEVVFYDTGMEYQAIYNIRDKIIPMLEERGIRFTELKPKVPFLYNMLEKPVNKKNGTKQNGYSWCGGVCRWATKEKTRAIKRHCKMRFQYVGIAYDEVNRLARLKREGGNKIPLLAELKMTEKDCLEYCYSKGFNWIEDGLELYSILDRVSCWCCSNSNMKELKNIYRYMPKYWQKLRDIQSKTSIPMKRNKYTVFDLEERFKKEIEEEEKQC